MGGMRVQAIFFQLPFDLRAECSKSCGGGTTFRIRCTAEAIKVSARPGNFVNNTSWHGGNISVRGISGKIIREADACGAPAVGFSHETGFCNMDRLGQCRHLPLLGCIKNDLISCLT